MGEPQWAIGTSREQEEGSCYYRERGGGMDCDSQSPSGVLGPKAWRLPIGGGAVAAAAVRMKQKSSAFYWIVNRDAVPSEVKGASLTVQGD